VEVTEVALHSAEEDRRHNNQAPSDENDELGSDNDKQSCHSVETQNQTTAVNNVAAGRDQGGILHDILEGERGVEDHGVVRGRDADNDRHRGRKPSRSPDMEGHDWVLSHNPELPKDKDTEEHQTGKEGRQGLGGSPTRGRGLGEIVDYGNDTDHKEGDTSIVDSTIGGNGVVVLALGNDEKSTNGESGRDDGCHVKDPVPTNGGIKDASKKNTNSLTGAENNKEPVSFTLTIVGYNSLAISEYGLTQCMQPLQTWTKQTYAQGQGGRWWSTKPTPMDWKKTGNELESNEKTFIPRSHFFMGTYIVKPAPAPWRPRETDMKMGFLAKPQTNDQTANQVVPSKNIRLWPNKSP